MHSSCLLKFLIVASLGEVVSNSLYVLNDISYIGVLVLSLVKLLALTTLCCGKNNNSITIIVSILLLYNGVFSSFVVPLSDPFTAIKNVVNQLTSTMMLPSVMLSVLRSNNMSKSYWIFYVTYPVQLITTCIVLIAIRLLETDMIWQFVNISALLFIVLIPVLKSLNLFKLRVLLTVYVCILACVNIYRFSDTINLLLQQQEILTYVISYPINQVVNVLILRFAVSELVKSYQTNSTYSQLEMTDCRSAIHIPTDPLTVTIS